MTKISWRGVLAGAAGAPVVGGGLEEAGDPMVELCREWRDAWAEAGRCWDERVRLQRELVARLGEPRVAAGVAADGAVLHAWADERIDALVSDAEARARLKAELAERRARWDAEADACGLSDAERREDEADGRLDTVLRAVLAGHAASLRGVVAKLDVAATLGAGEDDLPWAFLHGALGDLRGIAGA
ncbi:MAG TPA: hypothetical protein VGE72_00390 [Azospirillum sp.]